MSSISVKEAEMRKAISLKVRLWIEGEDEPAHNFAESTSKAIREIIAAGSSSHPELKVRITKITEQNEDPSEEK